MISTICDICFVSAMYIFFHNYIDFLGIRNLLRSTVHCLQEILIFFYVWYIQWKCIIYFKMELIYLKEYNNNNSHNNFYIFLILFIFLYISIFIYILILIISSLQLFEIKIIFLAFLRDIFYFIISKSICFFFRWIIYFNWYKFN